MNSGSQKIQKDIQTINIELINISLNIDTLKQVSYLKYLIKCTGELSKTFNQMCRFFLLFVYVCIAIGNQVIKRGGLGSY